MPEKPKIPVFEVSVPEYQVATEPDHKTIGKHVDDILTYCHTIDIYPSHVNMFS